MKRSFAVRRKQNLITDGLRAHLADAWRASASTASRVRPASTSLALNAILLSCSEHHLVASTRPPPQRRQRRIRQGSFPASRRSLPQVARRPEKASVAKRAFGFIKGVFGSGPAHNQPPQPPAAVLPHAQPQRSRAERKADMELEARRPSHSLARLCCTLLRNTRICTPHIHTQHAAHPASRECGCFSQVLFRLRRSRPS